MDSGLDRVSRGGGTPPRILLLGLGPTTLTALEGLASASAGLAVVALVRAGDDETVRRARQMGIPVFDDVTSAGVEAAVDTVRPDAVVVSSYNRLISGDLIARCPFVNVHYAPLPRGRGRATVNWALINGDSHAAISIHHLVEDLDAGGILYQELVPIDESATVTTLYRSLNELQRLHLADAVRAALEGDEGRRQVEVDATWLCTRTPADGEIDWTGSTSAIDRLIRALQDPFPQAFSWLGLEQLHICEARVPTDVRRFEGRVPGRVVAVAREDGTADVLTGDGVLRLVSVRLGDGPRVDAASVLKSVSMTLGIQTVELVRFLTSGAK